MAGDTQFGCLHSPQEIDADGLDLLAVCASLVELKKLLRFSAAALHIHRIVQHEIITAEHPVVLTAADIRQLFIPVGFTIQGFFDQFPRKNTGGALIITAVGKIDIRLAVYCDRNPLPDNTKAHRRKKLHIHLKADNIRYCYCKIRFFHLMSIQTKN